MRSFACPDEILNFSAKSRTSYSCPPATRIQSRFSGLAFVVGHSRPPAQVLGKVDKLRKFRDLLLEKLRVAAGLDV
jgi:hypothetical protein